MAAQSKLPADVVGLTKTAPVSRRGFMTASAATAAGYTLAAGPVRAQVVTTDTAGLTVGDAKAKVADGEMPVYFAKPANVQNPPVILVAMEIFGLHEYIKDVTRRLAKLGAFAVAPDYYFRKGVDLTKITEIPQLLPLVNSKPDAELIADLDATVAWAKSQGGDTGRLGIIGFCRGGRTVWIYSASNPNLKAGVAFYGSLVDPEALKGIWPKSPTDLAAGHEGARARPLRRSRPGHPGGPGRSHEGEAAGGGQEGRVQDLSRRPARLPRRLPAELPQGGGGRWLEPDDGLVQGQQGAGLRRTRQPPAAPEPGSRAGRGLGGAGRLVVQGDLGDAALGSARGGWGRASPRRRRSRRGA